MLLTTPNQMILIHLSWGMYQEGLLSTYGTISYSVGDIKSDGSHLSIMGYVSGGVVVNRWELFSTEGSCCQRM